MPKAHKIVIVGGGMSGLITACLLAKDGIDVVLLEKNNSCGGLVTSFTQEGFVFDAGIRAIENAGMMLPMLKELEIDLPFLPSKVSLGIEHEVIDAVSDDSINDYESLLKHTYPESIEEVENVISVIKDFNEYMKVLFGDQSPFYKDRKKDRRYFFTTFFPWMIKFLRTGMAVMRMRKPVEEYLHTIMTNDSLFDIISQHFFKNTPAFFAMSYFSLYTDYYYPKGGVGQLTKQLEKKVNEWGGSVVLNCEITDVDIQSKKVIDTAGNGWEYEKLIWCADLSKLYSIVDVEKMSGVPLKKVTEEKRRILSSKGAESVFTLFLAVHKSPTFFQNISHGHFFYTPSKEGLGSTHREDLNTLLREWHKGNKKEVLAWAERFCALNTFEISIPALNDPDTAPEGKAGVIISFLMDYDLVMKVESDGWYDEFSMYIENTLIDIFNNTIYPGIKENIIFKNSSSPLSVKRRVGSNQGAIVGWSFESPIPVDAGMLNMKKAVLTSLPDVYKAGQWTVSPAGLPTCIMTAKMVSDRVKKDL